MKTNIIVRSPGDIVNPIKSAADELRHRKVSPESFKDLMARAKRGDIEAIEFLVSVKIAAEWRWYRQFYLSSKHWKNKRLEAIEIQGARCRICLSKEGPFHVDHLTYETLHNEDTIRDLNVLCGSCHRDVTFKRRVNKRRRRKR
jgi:5-methylcytosine-specific restriction endonuclease McrA